MWHNFRSALSLPASEQWILAQAWILLLCVDCGLRCLPYRQVVKLLTWREKFARRKPEGDVMMQIRCLDRMVKMASGHHLYSMTCLRQSLVLQHLLILQGINLELRIGVRKEVDIIEAHAWLEYQGVPIGQPQRDVERFAPLISSGT